MRLTIIHPAIGHRVGENYIKSWQMEPLPAAVIAGLTPDDIEICFYDDRLENIPFEQPTDAVALSIETYTAKRAYQIASEYRRCNIPVIMGGFHATMMPDEVIKYADAIVVGEAENVWQEVIDDLRFNTLKPRYQSHERPNLGLTRIDRRIFVDKRYLPISLIETGRGCKFPCDFCAIQTFFEQTHNARPIDNIINEILMLRDATKLFFFVDDNFAADMKFAKQLLTALAELKIRWVTQLSINAVRDEKFLALLKQSGCQGVLIGFESLNEQNLKSVKKTFNTINGGYQYALDNLRRYQIPVYATFVFGLDHDTEQSFADAVDFALDANFYIAAFNHLTPFPGTPLYQQLQQEDRLRFHSWWLDDNYRYNDLPFVPRLLSPEDVTRMCVAARKRFYSWRNIAKRIFAKPTRSNLFMWRNFLPINLMHRFDINKRHAYPLGDERLANE